MHEDNQYTDLRLLSLLHAIGAAKDFVELVSELTKTQRVDPATWRQICAMGRELAPRDPTFQCGEPPVGPDPPTSAPIPPAPAEDSRNNRDRRAVTLTWIGAERRKKQRGR